MGSSIWHKTMDRLGFSRAKNTSAVSGANKAKAETDPKAEDRKNVSISYNVSGNPFAYLRTEEDVNRFVANIRKTAGEKGTNDFLQFMWLITMYLVKYCCPHDRSIETMLKVVKDACQPFQLDGIPLTFEIMLEDTKDESLLEKFNLFKVKVISFDSSVYHKVYHDSIAFLSSVDEKDLLTNLKYFAYPTHAVLREGDSEYEVWVSPSRSKIKSEYYGLHTFEVFFPSFFFDDKAMKEFGILHGRNAWDLRAFLSENLEGFLTFVKNSMTARESLSVRPDFSGSDEDLRVVQSLYEEIPTKLTGQAYQSRLQEKLFIAVHEAGHAVAHSLFGHEIVGASLHRIKGYGGRVRVADRASLDPTKSAVSSYAAFIAVKLICGVEDYFGSGEDFICATQVIKEAVENEAKEKGNAQQLLYIDADELGLADKQSPYVVAETIRRCMDCYDRAFSMIEENKNLVDLLAARLLQKETMTGAEIKAFCDDYFFHRVRLFVPESADLPDPVEVQEEKP